MPLSLPVARRSIHSRRKKNWYGAHAVELFRKRSRRAPWCSAASRVPGTLCCNCAPQISNPQPKLSTAIITPTPKKTFANCSRSSSAARPEVLSLLKKTPSISDPFSQRCNRSRLFPSAWYLPTQLTPWIPSCARSRHEPAARERIALAYIVQKLGPESAAWAAEGSIFTTGHVRAIMTKHPKEADRLKKLVEAFPTITVTVLGDLVADKFIFGEISRVSREAPVLILKHRERTVVPGGAANAATNLADLGVNVLPVGIVGDDEPGRMLLKYFRHKRIVVSGALKDKSYNTITKTRILAGMTHTARQQVVRIDREPQQTPNPHLTRELSLAARNYAHASDALLVSDYGYGAATPALLNALREKGKLGALPIVVDSRYRLMQYSGATAATPNEPEVEEALGIRIGHDWEKVVAAGRQVMERMHLQSLVITRGRDGMVAFDHKHKPVDIPIFGSDQVTDVTGAGDTVIAAFTAALAAGGTTEEAAQLANYAGGIVVMKRGTATVSREELLRALEQSPPVTRPH